MRKVLIAVTLLVLCSATVSAKPARELRGNPGRLARPAVSQPSLLLRIQKSMSGWIRTMEDPPPPPPPPGDDPGRSNGPIP